MAAVLFSTLIVNCFVFSCIFWLLTFLAKFFYSNKYSNHKYNFYECGFKHNTKATPVYEINYLLIVLFVLIYDGEFLILLPLTLNRDLAKTWMFACVAIVFVVWLVLALLFDYSFKALEWQVLFSFTYNPSSKASVIRNKKPLTTILNIFSQTTFLNASFPYYSLPYRLTKRDLRKFTMADVHILYILTIAASWWPLLFIWAFFVRSPQLLGRINTSTLHDLNSIENIFVIYCIHIRLIIVSNLFMLLTTKFCFIDPSQRLALIFTFCLVCFSYYLNIFGSKSHPTQLWASLCLFLAATTTFLLITSDLLLYFFTLELYNVLYMYCFLSQLSYDITLVRLKNMVLLYILSGFMTTVFFFCGLLGFLKSVGSLNFIELKAVSSLVSYVYVGLLLLSVLVKLGGPGIYFFKLELYKLLNTNAVLIFSICTFLCNTLLLYFLVLNVFYSHFIFGSAIAVFLLITNAICLITGFRLNTFGFLLGFSALTTWGFIILCFAALISLTVKFFYMSGELAKYRAQIPQPICFSNQLSFLKLRRTLTRSLANRACLGSKFNKHYLLLQSWFINQQRNAHTKNGLPNKDFFAFTQNCQSGFKETYNRWYCMRNLDVALLWRAKQIESIFNIKISTTRRRKKTYHTEVVYYLHPSRRINFCWRWLALFIKTLYIKDVNKSYSFTPVLENFLLTTNKDNTIYKFKQKAYRLFAVRSN